MPFMMKDETTAYTESVGMMIIPPFLRASTVSFIKRVSI